MIRPFQVSVTWQFPDNVLILGEVRTSEGLFIHEVDLGMILFSRHRGSMYGTLCNYVKVPDYGDLRAIALTPLEAVDYFRDPIVYANQFADITWSDDLSLWQQAALFIHEHLRTGGFVPDFAAWQQGLERWKPNGDIPTIHAKDTPIQLNVAVPFFDDWFDAAVRTLLRSNHEIATAWEATTSANSWYTSNRRNEVWFDEEDFLIALGLRESTVPFHVALRLDEPIGDDGLWPLHVFLQQKDDETVREAWPLSLAHPWQAFSAHVNKQLTRAMTLFPWLAAGLGTETRSDTLPDHFHDGEIQQELRPHLDVSMAWRFLAEASVRLPETGLSVFVPAWWKPAQRSNTRVTAAVKSPAKGSSRTWLGLEDTLRFDWHIAIDDVKMTDSEFRALVRRKQELVQFRGQWIAIDEKLARELEHVLSTYRPNEGMPFHEVLEQHLLGGRPVTRSQSESEVEVNLEVELDKELLQMMHKLERTTQIPTLDAPAGFQGILRPYQQKGYSWLSFLHEYGLGACLADDMGLGKTVQYIAYALHIKELRRAAREQVEASHDSLQAEDSQGSYPCLLVCPTSVIGNWQHELAKFAPSLRVYVHYGSSRRGAKDFVTVVQDYDIVLTSYTLCHMDLDTLSQVYFASICLDEAQNIKNPYTKQSAAIRKLRGHHRIAMTGTPIENRLMELWSIFQFLNPGYLGSVQAFSRRFVSPIERSKDRERTVQLQRLIQPFLLRRTKHDEAIALDLPAKSETKEYVPLTAEQASLYTSIVEDMLRQIDALPPMARRGLILASLTRLKQLCDHPALYLKTNYQRWRNRSAKVTRLLELIAEARSEGDKCLIFTQFVEAGELLKTVLEHELSEEVLFLHGSLAKTARDKLIARFQSEDGPSIFILSLKAGGVGLNLTAASHVFHFDRWWNPAVEDQATDRAYRIGQTRHVQVHKFIAVGTLEERIDQMIDSKQSLRQQVVSSSEQWITELPTDDLRDLFRLRHQLE